MRRPLPGHGSSSSKNNSSRAEGDPPALVKLLLVAGEPIRRLVALNLWAGRSIQHLAAALGRQVLVLAGWLYGRAGYRRWMLQFERQYFPLRRWHVLLAGVLAAKALHWGFRQWHEVVSGKHKRRRDLLLTMDQAQDYDEWSSAALELEDLDGIDERARWQVEARLYDRRLVQERRAYLTRVRERGEVVETMFALRADLLRNLGNMTNAELHEHFPVVPEPIQAYIQEVTDGLRDVTFSPELPLEEKLNFLREARHAFGRTALVLSGGGSFGAFHLGVVQALLDAGMLPRVISGSSAGSIVSSMLCTRTDDELCELFECLPEMEGIDFYFNNTPGALLKHFVFKGTLQDHEVLQERLRRLLGDMTFAEAYQRTGRILNIAVCAADTSEPPRLLNYLTSPNVLIWSAVACSSAFPFLFAPQDLMARDNRGRVVRFTAQAAAEMQRRWRDGSLEEDLPMRGLSEMFNVNYFLVSQCNPYLLPIVAFKRAMPGKLGNLIEGEFKHRCKQLMDVLPHWLGASRLLKLLNQPWGGDVNMILPVTTFGTLKSVINLTREDLLVAIQVGRKAVWEKLSAIKANCAIEVTMDECLKKVTVMAARERRRKSRQSRVGATNMRRGLPSWVHMPSLGRSESCGEPGMTPVQSLEAMRYESALSSANLDGSNGELPMLASYGQHLPPGIAVGQPVGQVVSAFVGEGTALSHDLRTTSVPEGEGEGIEEEEEADEAVIEEALTPRDPKFEKGSAVWKDLFSLAPGSGALTGDALDCIAP
ncbi:hypothetical protein N2152v2_005589 [Parachlorella kessleri]